MNLEISLALGRSEVFFGEDTALTILYRNASQEALLLPDPERKGPWSAVRVRNVDRGTESSFSPTDIARRGGDSFVPPMPAEPRVLTPGETFRDETTLLRRVELAAPGRYELTAGYGYEDGRVESKPVQLTVLPAKLRTVEIVGAHSGYSPYRYAVWSAAQNGGSVMILSCVTFDRRGNARQTISNRLAEVPGPARPLLSVSQNNLPYENHWIVWLIGNVLHGLYVKQGNVQVRAAPQSVGLANPTIIGPVLHDLTGSDGTRPGRGEIAFWTPAIGRSQLHVQSLDPRGSLGRGPVYETPPGDLRWARAFYLGNGERRYLLLVERKDGTSLEMVRWRGDLGARGKIEALDRWNGRTLGAGAGLDERDTLFGAAVQVAGDRYGRQTGYSLQAWRVEADGEFRSEPPIPIQPAEPIEIDRAVVELSRRGNIVAFLRARDGRWLICNRHGQPLPLPDRLLEFGEPIGALWLQESEPLVVMQGPARGITYQKLLLER